jgi:hypothetical protein
MVDMTTEMATAAQAYAARGWPVFPVRADKSPRTAHGHKDATRDSRLIEEWDRRGWFSGGVALAIPDGLLVFDIDPRNGGVRPSGLPLSKESGTRSGGAHIFFSVPPDLTFKGQYSEGVDLKAPGKGYVILPPTPGYHWKTPRREVVPLPNDVLDQVVRLAPSYRSYDATDRIRYLPWEPGSAYGLAALSAQQSNVRDAHPGERNNTLFRAACAIGRLIAGGELRGDPALKVLWDAGMDAGLDEWEVTQTLESGYLLGIEEPRSAPQ